MSWPRIVTWRREWQPTSVFLPGESNGQRSLVGYSPWGPKELDTTERLTLSLSLSERQVWGHLCRAVNPKPSRALFSPQLIKDQPDCLLLESEMERIEDISLHSYSSIKTHIKTQQFKCQRKASVPKVPELDRKRKKEPRERKSHIACSE